MMKKIIDELVKEIEGRLALKINDRLLLAYWEAMEQTHDEAVKCRIAYVANAYIPKKKKYLPHEQEIRRLAKDAHDFSFVADISIPVYER